MTPRPLRERPAALAALVGMAALLLPGDPDAQVPETEVERAEALTGHPLRQYWPGAGRTRYRRQLRAFVTSRAMAALIRETHRERCTTVNDDPDTLADPDRLLEDFREQMSCAQEALDTFDYPPPENDRARFLLMDALDVAADAYDTAAHAIARLDRQLCQGGALPRAWHAAGGERQQARARPAPPPPAVDRREHTTKHRFDIE